MGGDFLESLHSATSSDTGSGSEFTESRMLSILLAACLLQGALSVPADVAPNAEVYPQPGDPRDSPQQPAKGNYFGDVKLNHIQIEALEKGGDMSGSEKGYAAVNGANLRWKNAIIPYEFDCSIENLDDAVNSAKAAMAEWEAKTCIRFVKHTNEKFRLRFIRDTHCWGNVGQVSYSRISIGYGCEYQHVMTHEIGHVVGFYHEQNRMDRDDWVNVHWQNIAQFKDAFDKVKNTDSLGVPYDYESIMHYPWSAFSSNGQDTMSPKKNLNGMVPYIELSKADALQTSKMYNCPKIVAERKRVASIKHDGDLEVADPDYKSCTDQNSFCAEWARTGLCSKSQYVMQTCPVSCKAPGCDVVCTDQYPQCPEWERWGHCKLNPTVAKVCKKSCDPRCKKNPPTPPPNTPKPDTQAPDTQAPDTQGPATQAPVTQAPVTQPPVTGPVPTQGPTKPDKDGRIFLGKGKLCLDKHKKCDEWANQGECKRNPGWMGRNCMKACKMTNCDMGVLKPAGACANPLGLSYDGTGKFKIPDSSLYSPDNLSPGAGWEAAAKNARLYFGDDYDALRIGAWCAASHDQAKSANGYVQVDLGQQRTINYIATQGRDKYFERIGQFKISYSNNGQDYTQFQEGGKDKIFTGNCDHVTPVLNKFPGSITARYIRYEPWQWNYPCLRMELYGC